MSLYVPSEVHEVIVLMRVRRRRRRKGIRRREDAAQLHAWFNYLFLGIWCRKYGSRVESRRSWRIGVLQAPKEDVTTLTDYLQRIPLRLSETETEADRSQWNVWLLQRNKKNIKIESNQIRSKRKERRGRGNTYSPLGKGQKERSTVRSCTLHFTSPYLLQTQSNTYVGRIYFGRNLTFPAV